MGKQWSKGEVSFPGMIRLLTMLIGYLLILIWGSSDKFMPRATAASVDMTLALSSHQPNEAPSMAAKLGDELSKITADNYDGDFKSTEQMISLFDTSLGSVSSGSLLGLAEAANGNLVSSWQVGHNALIERMTHDLKHIYSSYGNKLRPLIQSIIVDRPQELNAANLAFRCDRHSELMELQQLASTSTIYRITMDVFFSELYVHCLIRKLATIKLLNIEPGHILRQFVDIYLDLPLDADKLGHRSDFVVAGAYERLASKGFNLEESIRRHGTMYQTADLVLDDQSMLSLGGGQADAHSLLAKFSSECQSFTRRLSEVWGQFDEVASFFSSPMSNLAEFNQIIKASAPQLLYATICNQLLASIAH